MHQSNLRQPPRENSGFEPQAGYTRQAPQRPVNQHMHRPVGSQRVAQQNTESEQGAGIGYQKMAHQRPMQAGHVQDRSPSPDQSVTRPEQQSGEDNDKPVRPDWFLQLNTYGGKYAFQLETSQTKDGWYTVNIESAPRENPKDPSNKRYLWNKKTVLQMTKSELPILTAVLLGLLPSARFDNHGQNFKCLEVINQGKNFFFKTSGSGLIMHVARVPTVDAFLYGSMALTQYARNFNGLSTESAMDVISRLANQLFDQGGYKPAEVRK